MSVTSTGACGTPRFESEQVQQRVEIPIIKHGQVAKLVDAEINGGKVDGGGLREYPSLVILGQVVQVRVLF